MPETRRAHPHDPSFDELAAPDLGHARELFAGDEPFRRRGTGHCLDFAHASTRPASRFWCRARTGQVRRVRTNDVNSHATSATWASATSTDRSMPVAPRSVAR